MNKLVFIVISILLTNIAIASDVFWYWDNDGATKGLLPDQNCQRYFSLDFPVKVIPNAGAHFTLYDAKSQIVTLKLNKFLSPKNKDGNSSSILTKHLNYELDYLKGVMGKDNLSIEYKKYYKNNKILSWVIKRQSSNSSSYLVANSVVKSGCVLYLTSLVTNKSLISKIDKAQQRSLNTLKSHSPTSEEEAKKLISDFTKS